MATRIFQEINPQFVGLYAASWFVRGREQFALFVMDDFGNLVEVH